MGLQPHEKEAMDNIMAGCKALGWVIAFPDGESDTAIINHMVIGTEFWVKTVTDCVPDGEYMIATPPND